MVVMEWQPEGKRKVGRPSHLKQHGEEQWKNNPGERGGPADQKSEVQG